LQIYPLATARPHLLAPPSSHSPYTAVDWDGDLPESEGICVNVFESDLFLLLDGFLEGAGGACCHDFDGKYAAGIIIVDETVEFEDRII